MQAALTTPPTSRVLEKMFFQDGTITGHYAKLKEESARYRMTLRVASNDGHHVQMERIIVGMHTAAAFSDALPHLVHEHTLDSLMNLLEALFFQEFYAELPFALADGCCVTFTVRDVLYQGHGCAEIICSLRNAEEYVCQRYIRCSDCTHAMTYVERLGFLMTNTVSLDSAMAIIEHLDHDAVVPVEERN